MIPKIIHYCWFGGSEKSQETLAFINKWRELNPGFEIWEWSEKNFDIHINPYVEEAYKAKKWAFVSDYVRLYALYEYGGIYLDTDVDEVKSFTLLLKDKFFIGAESRFSICTATIGAERHSDFIKEIIKTYENEHFMLNGKMNKTPNSQRIFHLLANDHGYEYSADNTQRLDIGIIYPAEYFSPINCYTLCEEITENTISIHRYAGTWKSRGERLKFIVFALLTRAIGESMRDKIKKKFR